MAATIRPVRLISVSSKANKIRAVLEVDVQRATSVSREHITVQAGDDLSATHHRPIYRGFWLRTSVCRKGDEYLQLSNQENPLRIGEAVGGVDEDAMKRQMIRLHAPSRNIWTRNCVLSRWASGLLAVFSSTWSSITATTTATCPQRQIRRGCSRRNTRLQRRSRSSAACSNCNRPDARSGRSP